MIEIWIMSNYNSDFTKMRQKLSSYFTTVWLFETYFVEKKIKGRYLIRYLALDLQYND